MKRESKRKKFIRSEMIKIRPLGSRTTNEFYKRFKTYYEYIISDEWKSIKRLYFKIYKKKVCVGCGGRKRIQLHHKSYKKLGGLNEIKDLISVCYSCHQEIHKLEKENNISVTRATNTILRSMKRTRIVNKDKIKARKTEEKLAKLKLKKETIAKDKLIMELKSNGFNAEYKTMPYNLVKNIHKKYLSK